MNDATDAEKLLFNKFCCALKFIKANNFDHLKSKYGVESQIQSKLSLECWEKTRNSTRIVLYHLEEIDYTNESQNYYMKMFVSNSELLKIFNSANYSDSNKYELETITWNSGWNLDPVHLNDLTSPLFCMSAALDSFTEIIAPIKSKKKL